jgi:CheY-like chemotaxis protein
MKTICLIDDDDIYKFILKKELEISGFNSEIMEFKNGKSAINFFEEECTNAEKLPEIIFLDMKMPVKDGWEFLEDFAQIKHKLAKEINIYMVSTSQDPKDYQRAKKITHISGYFVKPVAVEKLRDILKNSQESV